MYEYKCRIVRVVDGDTVDVDIDLGFNTWIHNERVRLEGVDTPESRTTDLIERFFGLLAKKMLEEKLPAGSTQVLQTTTSSATEKYGRTIGFFKSDLATINQWLIDNHYAVAYSGQNKDLVQSAHKSNYAFLLGINPSMRSHLLTEAKTTDVKLTEYLK